MMPPVKDAVALDVALAPSKAAHPALVSIARVHWPIALILLVAAVLLFTNLGRAYFWEDEGDTAVLARSILQHGVPVAWDGTTFVDPDYGQRLTKTFVMISHPWLQYYVAAASFAIFGDTQWAARFPFALAGLATILLVYLMMMSLVRSRIAAISAAALLTLNVQFLLFSRQARNYSFNTLLTCVLIWQFQRVKSWPQAALFGAIAILLFHTHPIGLAAVAGLALSTMVFRPLSAVRQQVVAASLGVAVYAVPWLLASRAGYRVNTQPLGDASMFLPRVLQFVAEWTSVAPVLGLIVLFVILWWRRRGVHQPVRRASPARVVRKSPRAQPLFSLEERVLLIVCGAVAVAEALAMAATHSPDDLWVVGLHHAPALIPLVLIPLGVLLGKISQSSRTAWVLLMLVFGFTRLPRDAPWTMWTHPTAKRDPSAIVTFHAPRTMAGRLLRTSQVHYVESLRRPNPGVQEHISEFLRAHAAPDDVVITNYGWEPLYFHTRLPQAAKVAPSFPIYPLARAAGLPDYVFDPAQADWIVWRPAWPAYFAEQNIPALLVRISAKDLVPRLAATLPETIYENRANIHFHRFAGDKYVFPPLVDDPADVQIFHVETIADAIVDYRRDVTVRPKDVTLLTDFGIALSRGGKADEALRAFQRARDLAPDSADAERNLASALFNLQEGAGALQHARRAVMLEPDMAAAHDVLGLSLAMEGRIDEAADEFRRALEIDPSSADARDHLNRMQEFRRQRPGAEG
jgi:4-amino-4-deoxy-L-arabinose transferase-like glycosyltransferase